MRLLEWRVLARVAEAVVTGPSGGAWLRVVLFLGLKFSGFVDFKP